MQTKGKPCHCRPSSNRSVISFSRKICCVACHLVCMAQMQICFLLSRTLLIRIVLPFFDVLKGYLPACQQFDWHGQSALESKHLAVCRCRSDKIITNCVWKTIQTLSFTQTTAWASAICKRGFGVWHLSGVECSCGGSGVVCSCLNHLTFSYSSWNHWQA